MYARIIYPEILVHMFLRGLTIRELADRVGVSYQSMRRKLQGETPLLLEEAMEIYHILGSPQSFEKLFEKRGGQA